MINISPVFLSDSYKVSHKDQYPKDTEVVYSNLTPRSSRVDGVNSVVVFGIQYFIREYLEHEFQVNFFNRDKKKVLAQYKSVLDAHLGGSQDVSHWGALHDLGYLPLEIKALPEGALCPLRVPLLTIKNTKKEFFWLTNWIETLLCNTIWLPITSATTARQFRLVADRYAKETYDILDGVSLQCHDFSMRGHTSVESACASSAGHLLSFRGTDTIPVLPWLCDYYDADIDDIGYSVPATEHSVACTLISSMSEKHKVIEVEEEFDEITQQWKILRTITNLDKTLV